MILFNTINRILIPFNRLISSDTIYYIKNSNDHWREWEFSKDYFSINYSIISKTDNKNYYRIEKQIKLFKYQFKRK